MVKLYCIKININKKLIRNLKRKQQQLLVGKWGRGLLFSAVRLEKVQAVLTLTLTLNHTRKTYKSQKILFFSKTGEPFSSFRIPIMLYIVTMSSNVFLSYGFIMAVEALQLCPHTAHFTSNLIPASFL